MFKLLKLNCVQSNGFGASHGSNCIVFSHTVVAVVVVVVVDGGGAARLPPSLEPPAHADDRQSKDDQ